MPVEPQPPPDPHSPEFARQKKTVAIVISLLVLGAVLIVILGGKIPLPLRLLTAGTDLAAAAALWLVLRQKFLGK